MTEELDAIMFDAGGVLWDLRPTHEDLFARTLSANGVKGDPARLKSAMAQAERAMDQEFSLLQGSDETEFWLKYDRMVLDILGAELDLHRFSSDLTTEFRKVARETESWVAFDDAVPTLEAARKRDFSMGMVSNATDLARKVLANLDMEKYFDFVVISEEVGIRKPDPRIFRMALDMAGATAGRSLFLGDKLSTDILGATGAGMRAILVDRNDVFPDTEFARIRSLNSVRRYL
jgi:putative hydrolase of the HAD superfamily